MARFIGKIGFIINEETAPGVYEDTTTEVEVRGILLRSSQKWDVADKVNLDFNITNRFSVICDPFMGQNLSRIAYIEWKDQKWKVLNAEIVHPRAIIAIGGVYNGD